MKVRMLHNSSHPYEGEKTTTVKLASVFTHDGQNRHASVSPRVFARIIKDLGWEDEVREKIGGNISKEGRYARFFFRTGGAVYIHTGPDYNPGICPCCQ